MVDQADPERIKRHLTEIAIPRDLFSDPANLLKVQSYVETQFISFGYRVNKHSFIFQNETFNNLIAHGPNFEERDRFIIGAHFDAVPGTAGADDNASGVAALLEAARILSSHKKLSHLEFIAFNAEEYGMVGSSFYVGLLKKRKATIKGMISLEMIGYISQTHGSQNLPLFLKPFYPSVGNFISLVGDTQSQKLLKTAKAVFNALSDLPVESITLPLKGWILSEARLSDHSPFWDAGYPALLVTDTSFFRNPHYHLPSDQVHTLDLNFLTKVTDAIIQLAHNLG